MSQLTLLVVRNCFRGQGVAESDYLSHGELHAVVSRMNGSGFDEQTFEELWDQCKLNSKGEVRLSDFLSYLLRGEELLIQKQQQNAAQITSLEMAFKGKSGDFSQQRKYKQEMEGLVEEREAIKNSLSILRRPFLVPSDALSRQGLSLRVSEGVGRAGSGAVGSEYEEEDIVHQMFEYDSSQTGGVLALIFYLTCALALLTWLTSFFTSSFLSLTAYALILFQFCTETISRKLVKFNLLLLAACSALDVLWFILYTPKVWYLPLDYELPAMASNYLKFSITFMVLAFCLRTLLAYFYLSQFHLDHSQSYSVRLLGREFTLQKEAEPLTPNKNPLSYMLVPLFNKPAQEGEHP